MLRMSYLFIGTNDRIELNITLFRRSGLCETGAALARQKRRSLDDFDSFSYMRQSPWKSICPRNIVEQH